MKTSLSRKALLGALGSTAALSALFAVAVAQGGSKAPSTPAPTSANPSSAGLVAVRDAETGALRAPTAEEAAALQPAPAGGKGGAKIKEASVPEVRRLPNGAIAMTLDSSFEMASVAVKGSDNKVRRGCMPSDKVETALDAAQNGGLTKKEVLDEK